MIDQSLKERVSELTWEQAVELLKERVPELTWEQMIEELGCDLTEIKFEDALAEDEFCDYNHPLIVATFEEILAGVSSKLDQAKLIYRFVREEIGYSFLDYGLLPASEILRTHAGGCFNKSILATALYRRARIPAIYGIGLLKISLLSSLLEKMFTVVWDSYLSKLDKQDEQHESRWTWAANILNRIVQGDKVLHITSCIHVGGRWFEADVTQNNSFLIAVMQADKYFPAALEMWDGTADYGMPERLYAGGKKKLKHLIKTEDLKLLFDFDDGFDDEAVNELFDEMRRQSSNIEFWLGRPSADPDEN